MLKFQQLILGYTESTSGLGLQAFCSMSNFVGVTWFSGLLWAGKLRRKYITEIGREQP